MANRYCGNCGSELSQDVRFCPSCGRPVHQTAQVSTPEADVDVPPPPGGAQTGTGATPGDQRRRHPILRGCMGTLVVILLLVIIVNLVGGGGETAGGGDDAGGGNGQQAQDSSEGQESGPVEAPVESSPEQSESASSESSEQNTIPGDGTFLVGEDIQPGTYETEGSESCYWERLSGTSGTFDDIITNGLPTGPTTITISPSDEAFLTEGCSEWTLR